MYTLAKSVATYTIYIALQNYAIYDIMLIAIEHINFYCINLHVALCKYLMLAEILALWNY